MLKLLEPAVAVLDNSRSGWVTRRDAAEQLAEEAAQAIASLSRHADDADIDVRSAALAALSKVTVALRSSPGESKPMTLDDLACSLAKPGERAVTIVEDGYAVDLALRSGRRQRVFLGAHTIREGAPLIRVMTVCGRPVDDTFEWALRANVMMAHGAIALFDVDGEPQLVIVRYYAAAEVKPAEVLTTIKEFAYYGDWIESKLSGKDER